MMKPGLERILFLAGVAACMAATVIFVIVLIMGAMQVHECRRACKMNCKGCAPQLSLVITAFFMVMFFIGMYMCLQLESPQSIRLFAIGPAFVSREIVTNGNNPDNGGFDNPGMDTVVATAPPSPEEDLPPEYAAPPSYNECVLDIEGRADGQRERQSISSVSNSAWGVAPPALSRTQIISWIYSLPPTENYV